LRTRFLACLTFLALVAGAIGGCGSSSSDNGVASKSPDEIVNAAVSAIDSATSAHVAGAVSNGGMPITLDLKLVAGKGGKGKMTESGLGFQIVAVNNEVYVNGSSAFWRHFGGAAAAALLDGKWLKAPATGQLASIAQVTNLHTLLNQLIVGHGTLTKGQQTTVNGQKVIAVTDTSKGGTIYVATTGKPYPVEVIKPGAQGGKITFDEYDQPVVLTAPPNAIDLSALSSG
jgi:hypothetical protein